jgi:hypothetical protein
MCWLQNAADLRHLPHFLLMFLALPGLVECFAGFRAWRFLLGLNGVLVGVPAGFFLGLFLLHDPAMALVAVALGAIGGAVIFATVMPVGTFIVAGISGFSFTLSVATLIHVPANTLVSGLALGIGLAAAGIALLALRPAIIVLSILAGAYQLAGVAAAYLYPSETMEARAMVPTQIAVFVVLAAGGLVTQWATNRNPHTMAPPELLPMHEPEKT